MVQRALQFHPYPHALSPSPSLSRYIPTKIPPYSVPGTRESRESRFVEVHSREYMPTVAFSSKRNYPKNDFFFFFLEDEDVGNEGVRGGRRGFRSQHISYAGNFDCFFLTIILCHHFYNNKDLLKFYFWKILCIFFLFCI